MKHGSLFSGIGGFDLAAEWMGWDNTFHCEWNEFGQKVLKHHFPKAISYDDITKTDFTIHRGRIDVLSGGFPCQPYSLAGKRQGKNDERHLWPHMLRAIREIKPNWVVGENVRGILNWNDGVVFEEVCAEMEDEGFEVLPFILPAASVNAPHQRYRVWFVAHSNECDDARRPEGHEGEGGKERLQERDAIREPSQSGGLWNDANAEFKRLEGKNESRSEKGREWKCLWGNATGHSTQDSRVTPNAMCGRRPDEEHRQTEPGRSTEKSVSDHWRNFPTQPPVRTGDDGFRTDTLRQRIREDSMGLLSEEEIDTIISKATSKWVKETIKAGGNAVVPPLVLNIFNAINKYDEREAAELG